MRELSLNILDIAQNSVKAGAKNIGIAIEETDGKFSFSVTDDGCGMSPQLLATVKDPFTTTRTTRKVGLGIPFLTLAARQTGGDVAIESRQGENHGTVLTATFDKTHIDFTPLGDIVSTVVTLVQGNPGIDFVFTHEINGKTVSLDTRELRAVLGDVPLSNPEVLVWIKNSLNDEYMEII